MSDCVELRDERGFAKSKRLDPPVKLLWKVPVSKHSGNNWSVFGSGFVFTAGPSGNSLLRVSAEGCVNLESLPGRVFDLFAFDEFSGYRAGVAETVVLDRMGRIACRVPETERYGARRGPEGEVVLEFLRGGLNILTGSYETVSWREGWPSGRVGGRVLGEYYYGAWPSEGNWTNHESGCLDSVTGEVVWKRPGVLSGKWCGGDHLVVLAKGSDHAEMHLLERATGEFVRELPRLWAEGFVVQGTWAADRRYIYDFTSGEVIAEFPHSDAPIALTDGLAWICERHGTRWHEENRHYLVCYDLEAREEVWRKSLGKTGPSAFAQYGYWDGFIYRLRDRSLECYGR